MEQLKYQYRTKSNNTSHKNNFKAGIIKASKILQIAFACIGYTLLYLFIGSFGGKLENKKI